MIVKSSNSIKKFKKSIYLVIDALRFDAIKDDLKSKTLYPTLTALAQMVF